MLNSWRALARLAAPVGLLLGFTVGSLTPALAFKQAETTVGAYLWWQETTIPFKIDASLPSGWDADVTSSVLDASFAPWAGRSCYGLTFVNEGYATGATEADDKTNWIRWNTSWDYGSKLIALTSVHAVTDTGRILDADIEVNIAQKDYSASFDCSPQQAEYDLYATMVHEVGHLVGLDHSTLSQATMNAVTEPGDCKKRTLDPDDEAGFCQTYENLPGSSDDLAGAELSDASGGGGGNGCATSGTASTTLAAALFGLLLGLLGLRARHASS